jgi:TatD DNase family protein
MVHCYSEGPRELEEWLRRGFFVSFAGTVTYPGNDALREAAVLVPEDRLLVETDAPYLAPQGRRGERNEPAFAANTLAAIASLRGTDTAVLGRQVTRNARSLFGIRWS